MNTIKKEDLTAALSVVFKEAFEGMATGETGVIFDHGVGFFNTLAKLDAAQASTEINATTIAAHSEHARFYLALLDNYLKKDYRVLDFNQSWRITTVSENDWDELRENLAKIYRQIGETVRKIEDWDTDTITVVLGMLAHTTYHLGAIRQMSKKL